jgi:hypothetical protein
MMMWSSKDAIITTPDEEMGEQQQTMKNAMCLTEQQSCTWVVAGLVAALTSLVRIQSPPLDREQKEATLC